MKIMKKIFGDLKMNWLTVVLFAVIAGVYTGVVMLIPFLKETSFQDIGISYEWWVIFAVIVVVNCNKGWEAMLKCFVFFLISQPIIYGVEIIFGSLSFDLAMYYYRTNWLPATFLTLPGGFIAYFCKKQNVAGAIVLGIGNSIQAALGVYYLSQAIHKFPHHLLSSVLCFASIVVMSLCIQKEKKNRIVAFAVPVILVILTFIFARMTGRTFV